MNTVVSHYARIDIKGSGEFEVWLVEETFDLGEYLNAQIKWAMRCPYNRNGVREKMGWSDHQLDANPDAVLAHFIEQHGDEWFRDNLRPKFIKTRSTKLEKVNPVCFLVGVKQHCQKCPECLVAKLGISSD